MLLAAVAGLGGCGGGGQRTGSPNDPFYGVVSAEPLPGASMLARLGRGGVGTLRINFAWTYVQSGPHAPYDWSHYDSLVAGAARNGIRVLATVYSSPTWAEASPETPPLGRALPGFEAFIRAAARRYGSDGSFWAAHSDLPKLPITNWQLWNEPNSPLFWKPAPNAGQYLTLLRGFAAALHAGDSQGRVVLGGLFPTPPGGIPMASFLAQLYREGAGSLLDAASIHPYAATPTGAIRTVEGLRETLRHLGAAAEPIWVSEVGWASGGAPSGVTVGPARQAAYLTRTFELALRDRNRLGIAGVVWYSLMDDPGPIWVNHCGLFTEHGAPKPSWTAYTDLTGGAG